MKKLIRVCSIVSIVTIIGFVTAFYFEASNWYPYLALCLLFSNLIITLSVDTLDFKGLENLDKLTRETRETYKSNNLFIKAFKAVLLRDKYPLEVIEKEMEKIKISENE